MSLILHDLIRSVTLGFKHPFAVQALRSLGKLARSTSSAFAIDCFHLGTLHAIRQH
jgi:hypothetical protein